MAASVLSFSLSLLALLSSLWTAGQFDGYNEESIPTGQLFWKGWPIEDRLVVKSLLPRALAAAEERLERKLGRPFTTVLVPDGFELRRVVERMSGSAPSPHAVLGVALPGPGVLVIKGGYLPALEPLSVTVGHEVAHLVIHRSLQARIPRWLDEGIATWLTRPGLPDADEAYLSFLARVDGLYRLESLELRFPDAHELSSVAYQQSFLFISYLTVKIGQDAVPRLLDLMEEGASSGSALRKLTGVPLKDLETEFQGWVAARRTLGTALSSVFNLWTVCALLALAAIGRYWLRRRRRMAGMAAEEGETPAREPLSGPQDVQG